MFQKNKATNVSEYFVALPKERKATVKNIDELIRETVPSLKRHFANNMIGYGKINYINSKKQNQVWPIVALANQKNYISIYVCAVSNDEYLAEKYKNKLGKVSVGKSCIRFKKIEDINLETLKKILKLAAKNPGFGKS